MLNKIVSWLKLVDASGLLLVLFVAGAFVILEAQYHAFSLFDQSTLNLTRISRQFAHQGLNPKNPVSGANDCTKSGSIYSLVLLPAGTGFTPTSSPAGSSPLWLKTVAQVRAASPRVIALDLDVSRSGIAAKKILETITAPAAEDIRTSLATIALPIPEDAPNASALRQARNDWLRTLCKTEGRTAVAIASPLIDRSVLSNSAVQFRWQRLHGWKEVAPPVYAALGQITRLLGDRLDASDAKLGPGVLCSYLTKTLGDERIPFVEAPDRTSPAEVSGPLFQAQRHADELFSIEWLNPYAVERDIPIIPVQSEDDLRGFATFGKACFADKVVFIGQRSPSNGADSFPTSAADSTPGVMVHAMVARSTDTGLRSAIAVNAAVDFLVGYILIALGKKIPLPNWATSPSFALRVVAKIGRLTGPLLVIAVVLAISGAALPIGLFLNPLVVFLGMWLHGVLGLFMQGPQGAQMAEGIGTRTYSHKWIAWLPRFIRIPRMAESGWQEEADQVVYGGLLCFILYVIGYAVYLVLTRISIRAL